MQEHRAVHRSGDLHVGFQLREDLAGAEGLLLDQRVGGQRQGRLDFLGVRDHGAAREAVLRQAVHLADDRAAQDLAARDVLAVTHLGFHAAGQGVRFLTTEAQFAVLVVAEQLAALERAAVLLGVAGRGDQEGAEVQHLLQLTGAQVQQRADLAGRVLHVPDVRGGRREVDVTHAVAAHLAAGHLDAAALADLALVPLALVLPAGALVVLLRPEDTLVEQTLPFGFQGAVVDGFGFLDLTERPLADLLRAGDGDTNFAEIFHDSPSEKAEGGRLMADGKKRDSGLRWCAVGHLPSALCHLRRTSVRLSAWASCLRRCRRSCRACRALRRPGPASGVP